MKKFFSIISILLCPMLYGQSIFSNDINTNNPSSDNPYTLGQTLDVNITVSGIGRGPDINGNIANNRYNARDWNLTTLDTGDYFYFTLTPNTGYEIDFTNFIFNVERSNTGPVEISVRSSIDNYTSDIGAPTIGPFGSVTQSIIDLSNASHQNISSSITFRVYAWGGSNTNGTLSVNDFMFNGAVNVVQCPTTVTWDGSNWSGPTTTSSTAIINGNYSTSTNGSFSACSLTVNSGFRLTVNNSTYIEIENDVVVDGDILVESQGAFVQNNDLSSVTVSGNITVEKLTPPLSAWYEYIYWSSPVSGETIGSALSETDPTRRFVFNAQNFLDATMETNNNDATVAGQDDIDDNANDWELVNAPTTMLSGIGYASTHDEIIFKSTPGGVPKILKYTFNGPFNNGEIRVPIYRNDSELNDNNWNLIGNPYPSAIDADLFLATNSNIDSNVVTPYSIDGAIFLWSQNTPPSRTNNGNEAINFSDDDYAIINGIGQIAGGDGIVPDRAIQSGQGFFVSYSNTGNVLNTAGSVSEGEVIFNNAMRIADFGSNDLFFKSSNKKKNPVKVANKLWINLTSDSGVFNQILIGYLKNATDKYDGSYFDTTKNPRTGNSASIYSLIKSSPKKFAIQGKSENSLRGNEKISLGFRTKITKPTLYTFSIDKVQGEFLLNNTIYLKDKLLKKWHDLKDSDYQFTSEVGEFNKRFEIVFNKNDFNDKKVNESSFSITSLGNNKIKLNISDHLVIKNIKIYDALKGRLLHSFKGNSSSEIVTVSRLSSTFYITKVELSDGAIITKKIML